MIKFQPGMKLQLWVWDRGVVEGFSVYKNGTLFDTQQVVRSDYDVAEPAPRLELQVKFLGVDGGATKIVDVAAGAARVLAFKDDGLDHDYVIEK